MVRVRRALRGPLRPTWDENFETLATLLRAYGRRSHWVPLGVQRRAAASVIASRTRRARATAERVSAGGVRAEWITTDASAPDRVLLYLHGGGYSIGSIDSHRDLVERLATASEATALALDYRLAPEHPFPAQLEDALAAYRWLLAGGNAPSRIAVAGDSAGGGLTLSLLLSLRDRGEPLPACAVCISPWTDLELTGASLRENSRYDYVGYRTLRAFRGRFVPRGERSNPLASPALGDFTGLPPLLVHAGAVEALLDDSRRLAERADRAGVRVSLEVAEDMIHAFHLFAPGFAEPRRAIAAAGRFILENTYGKTTDLVALA